MEMFLYVMLFHLIVVFAGKLPLHYIRIFVPGSEFSDQQKISYRTFSVHS